MNNGYRALDLTAVRTESVARRRHLVRVQDFAGVPAAGAGVSALLEALPRTLKADDLRRVVDAIVESTRERKPVILGLGAHVIKCGLSPLIINFMRRGAVSAVALNGGGAIHDFELAVFGETSEDVGANLADGCYGMVAETGGMIAEATAGARPDEGLGGALGRLLAEERTPYGAISILQSAHELGIPATVHVAIGTDTIHMLPEIDAGRLGELSHRDFRLLASVVGGLQGGGVYLNVGSAVVLPEVFLKCVTLCRNLGYEIGGFTTVDMDMVRHYRPATNVIERQAALGAKGYSLTGHHEIMLPLLAFAVVEALEQRPLVAHAGANGAGNAGR